MVGVDVRPRTYVPGVCGDLCDPDVLAEAVGFGVDGVVHLGAVSRVVDGQRDPEECHRVNVEGTRMVLEKTGKAWFLYASSREVYGEPKTLPVRETNLPRPLNAYARSKVEAEKLVEAEPRPTGIVRLANVYGSVWDHPDRVVPAFCRAAATGGRLRVEGSRNLFDLNHVRDAVRGMVAMVRILARGATLPPIHLVSGVGTTLGDLATMAIEAGGGAASWYEAPSRDYDVAMFVGDPTRARELLGWSPEVSLRDGVESLTRSFAKVIPERENASRVLAS